MIPADPNATPAGSGYRWPAEWEPHAATWLSWPHNRETWPALLEAVERVFARIVEALYGREQICINVTGVAMEDAVRTRLRGIGVDPDRGIQFFPIPTDDAWIRDHGPIFLTREPERGGGLALVDFEFDAWGGKYPPWDLDNAVPGKIAECLGVSRFKADRVLEAGSIDGNGRSSVLTTESCLMNSNRTAGRGPGTSSSSKGAREEAEAWLAEYLGCTQVLWLAAGIEGDDTDGHVDDIARFIAPNRIAAVLESDPGDLNFEPLRENMKRLKQMRDLEGKSFEIVTLPMPPRITAVPPYPPGRLPASYANFYLANQVALVPVFDVPSDERALKILAECLPGREIVPIPSRDLVVGLGAVHCLTQQQPAITPNAP